MHGFVMDSHIWIMSISTFIITNSTFTENSAGEDSVVITCSGASMNIDSSSFNADKAATAGGIYNVHDCMYYTYAYCQ